MKTAIEVTPLRKWLAARMAEGRATLGTWLEQRGFDKMMETYGLLAALLAAQGDEEAGAVIEALDSVRRAAKADGLLNAHIIPGPCATCGGSGKVLVKTVEDAGSPGERPETFDVHEPCPDCPPPVIVPEAVWEAFNTALADAFSEVESAALQRGTGLSATDEAEYCNEVAPYIAAALLGPVRRAKEIIVAESSPSVLVTPGAGALAMRHIKVGAGESVALLHTEAK